jgi:cobalamin biosynthesis Co2+ chelatase CbiK
VMTKAGLEATCVIEGLGQMDTIDDIYVAHVQDAIDSL